ncbi:hypothetical protein C8A05DRAFT_11989 [Staphylotrichum tortipilum]|uniref:HAUS augmin-like complex subunit 1 n=1 Tax=Staphylotrichum tortipilum TaxID=2831512 RepID=A0AAN6MTA6_9PEZI|nr:hypothetical protein C8A05DRAFT_11989 [Staphylotrichum longicolle]
MAHLPLNAAIFSPSVARAAASAAKDWSYIDSWLQRKFPGRGPPPFERNADTLRALLALASANEAADEERALVARLEAETLDQLRAQEDAQDAQHQNTTTPPAATLHSAREAILTSLESSLTREGQTALTSLAALALQTNIPLPTPTALGAELISLSTETLALDQTTARVHTLTSHLAREAASTASLSASLRPPSPHPHDDHDHDNPDNPHLHLQHHRRHSSLSKGYHPSSTLALQNLTTQRRIKHLTARVPEQRDKAASLARSAPANLSQSTSIPHLRREEEAYLSLLSEKRALDTQVRAFAGLPPDAELARQELEDLRAELRGLTARRDALFEGLVERETPRKGRGGPPARR